MRPLLPAGLPSREPRAAAGLRRLKVPPPPAPAQIRCSRRSRPPREPAAQMETVQELIPLAKELMAQKPSAKLVRMYLLGGVLALFGAVLGLMEAMCGPFAAAGRRREREATLAELGEPAPREQGKPLEAAQACRALSNRLHAS